MIGVRAIVIAFSTYTRIPMPQIKLDDAAMKFAIAFLPLCGAAIGAALWGWQKLCDICGFSSILFAAVAVSLPVLITGGIHMDGYCDTIDALASWRERERRLEILKDPHVGAFALIRYGIYLLLYFALLYELHARSAAMGIVFLYPLSRCFAAWSAITMPNARKDGMLAAFTAQIDRLRVMSVLGILSTLALIGWVWLTFPHGIAALALCIPLTLWYRRMTVNKFGGATGDTTGFYLQIIELTLLGGMLFGEVLFVYPPR